MLCVSIVTKQNNAKLLYPIMASLQEQLVIIQENQKMRFKERSVCKDVPDSEGHLDLELKTITELKPPPEETESNYEANEIDVEFLQTQVETIQLENSQLKSRLKQTESKLVQVNHQREEERRAMGGSSSTVTQRIVELSKKNRELNAEVASERNKVREIQVKLKRREADIASLEMQSHCKQKSEMEVEQESLQSMVDQLKEQLQLSNQKRAEYRNECQTLKQDLKLAHRVISREVGEGMNVSRLLKSGGGWRGRSQQIMALQNKIGELQQQLDQTGRTKKQYAGTPSRVNADHRQVSTLKKLEDTKKRSLELAQNELGSIQVEYLKLQQQYSALKSRNKILTAELKSIKSHISGRLQPPTPTPQSQLAYRPPSNESIQDRDKMRVLEQRNQRLQTQLTKCLSELQSLKENGRLVPHSRQPKSAPLPPLALNRGGGTRSVTRKMVLVGEQEYSDVEKDALTRVDHMEKERLFELTLSLQQRLDLCNDKVVNAETELRNLRQRYSSKDRTKTTSSVGELEERLEITKDENEVLKETLEATRQEKLADIKLLQELIRETKSMFVDSVRQLCAVQSS